ncbi:MAG: hypothetical protein AAFR51_03285 [Pseudomonadota bacterium]
MRVLPVLLAAAVFAAPAFAEKPTPDAKVTVEDDTYRFGDLYRSERGTSVEACAQMCTQDSSCASWSLIPATFRLGPRCELKRTPGTASHRPGAVSGMSEFWQMDPSRHAEMRYQPAIPASRQPAAVPLEQLRPSPIPRTFGEPLPVREPELVGGPEQSAAIVSQPAPQLAARPVKTPPPQTVSVEVARGPAQGTVPAYVKQPVPEEPHPLYRKPVRTAQPAAAPTMFKDPANSAPQARPAQATFNAVQKRETQTVSAPPSTATPPPAPAAPAPAPSPAPQRVPWTERVGNDPNYSVSGGTFVPGDEDATAGFVDGVPEAGS